MAGEASKARFVRCPKCSRLLMEYADVPVYKCGGCEAVLQAKSRHDDKGNGTSQNPSSPDNNLETSSDVPILDKQRSPCSADPNSMEMGHGGDHVAVLSEDPACSNSEKNSVEVESMCSEREEEVSCCKGNGEREAGSASHCTNSTGQSAVMGEASISLASDASGKLSQHGSVNSSSSCKIGETTESVASEEDMADGHPGSRPICDLGTSLARISHAYDGSISSGDDISGKHQRYRLLSRRTFRNRNFSDSISTGAEDGEEEGVSGLKHRSSSRNPAGSPDQDASPGSHNLYPWQHELGSDHLSRSPSRDSTSLEDFPCNSLDGISSNRLSELGDDRMEPPRRVGLLRDQPIRPYIGGRRGERRLPIVGTRHESHRPLFSKLESEQELTPFCIGSTSQWHSTASVQESVAQQYQSSQIHFSGQGNGSCLHHHPEGRCVPMECRACSSHTCFHPPAAASSDCSLSSTETRDHRLGKLPERRQQRKRRRCRPVSGGAPFVVCNSCLDLLQLPVDFLVSRGRRHKLRCGACSEVLIFLYHGGHVVPHSSPQLDPSPTEDHSSMGGASKHDASVNRSHLDSVQEDPVSYSEESGPPTSQSYTTDGEPVACTLRSSQEQKGKGRFRQAMGPPLHHLLGYDSARDLVYEPSDEEDGCDSTSLSRFYRASGDVDLDVGYGGPIRKDTEELKQGLENLKLRSKNKWKAMVIGK